MNAPVLFEEVLAQNGMRIGVATLNAPQTLNGLSLAMVEQLGARLERWAQQPEIAVVILQGAGDKAFCAGGDLQSLYRSMRDATGKGPWGNPYARRFFELEYRLDYRIHTYPKPLLCWGHGIVMGGGIGLMMGASHRVVSEQSRLAMPEISIGLFPDVGGSWCLSRIPGRLGLFLALTGAQMNAADALYVGLADYALQQADWPTLRDALSTQPWQPTQGPSARAVNDAVLHQALMALTPPSPGAASRLQQHAAQIHQACRAPRLDDIVMNLAAFAQHEDPWLARAAQTMQAGSPGALRLAFTLQQRLRLCSLDAVFRSEYIAALVCAAQGDFEEGIRALLIDKDKTPRWQLDSVAQATEAWVAAFFEAPWPAAQAHPLSDLGQSG